MRASSPIDSLVQRLEIVDGAEKVKTYVRLVDALKFSDQTRAIAYGVEGLNLSKRLGLEALEGRVLLNLGIAYAIKADYPASIEHYELAIQKFRKLENVKGLGQATSNLGMTYARLGKYDDAVAAYDSAIVVFKLLRDSSTVLKIRGNQANIAYRRGYYDDALETYESLLEYGQKNRIPDLVARYHGNIGRVQRQKGAYPEALEQYYLALDLMDSLGNQSEKANLFNDIGILFDELGMLEQAEAAYRNGLLIGNIRDSARIMVNIADLQLGREDYQNALKNITTSIALYDSLGVKSTTRLYITLAAIEIGLKDYGQAEQHLDHALKVGKELGQSFINGSYHYYRGILSHELGRMEVSKEAFLRAMEAYEEAADLKGIELTSGWLAKMYESEGAFELALQARQRESTLSDSLLSMQEVNEIIQLELDRQHKKYRSEQKDQAAETEGRVLPIWPWYILAFIVLAVIGFVQYHLRNRKYRKGSAQMLQKLNAEIRDKRLIEDSLRETQLEMTLLSLDLAKKQNFIKGLDNDLVEIAKGKQSNQQLLKRVRMLKSSESAEREWEVFQRNCNQLFPRFFDRLQSEYPNLSVQELRHCGLIRLRVSLQEVAEIKGVSVASIHKARHRLRSKFKLDRGVKLETFLLRI